MNKKVRDIQGLGENPKYLNMLSWNKPKIIFSIIIVGFILFLIIIGASTKQYLSVSKQKPNNQPSNQQTPTPTFKTPQPTQTPTPTTQITTAKSGNNSLYPNYSLTPGEVFSAVTASQVCISGYSSSVRSVSDSLKKQVYAEYDISYPQPTGEYEVDHFISLELGGDNSIKNLWPEPANPTPGFHQKDLVENYLHSEVCSGKITLIEAQNEIKTDWYKVYLLINENTTNSYIQPASNTTTSTGNTSGSTSTNTSTTKSGQATGRCNDGTETYAVNHQGACSHHGGIAQWY